MNTKLWAFAAIVLVCIAGIAGYTLHVLSRERAAEAAMPAIAVGKLGALPAVATGTAAAPASAAPVVVQGSEPKRPYLLFRSTALGATYGQVGAETLGAAQGPRLVAGLQCERVHFAAGHGLCLQADRGVITTYRAHLFDRNFRITHTHPLPGTPSRARISPDGRLAAMTVFVSGHSYASVAFTTRTSLIDTASGKMLAEDLEKFDVYREGEKIKAVDYNFWGVTFARSGDRFYATLGTAGKTLLVEGDIGKRAFRVVHDNVECPSLSPDNTKIAFKRRQAMEGGRIKWGIHVLDIASGKETALSAEARNVDDQVEWLDDATVLYGMPEEASAATNVWALGIDGASAPRLLLPLAFSPAVVR